MIAFSAHSVAVSYSYSFSVAACCYPVDSPRLPEPQRHFRTTRTREMAKASLDPAEVMLGERLFLETRFAQFFFAHCGGNVNTNLSRG